jgi:hypothetical protein
MISFTDFFGFLEQKLQEFLSNAAKADGQAAGQGERSDVTVAALLGGVKRRGDVADEGSVGSPINAPSSRFCSCAHPACIGFGAAAAATAQSAVDIRCVIFCQRQLCAAPCIHHHRRHVNAFLFPLCL